MMETRPSASVSKGAVLWIASLSAFLTPFIVSSVNVALPSIDQELKLTAVELNWVSTAYLLAAAIFLVPFGRIADILGRKKIYTSGLIVNMIASILCIFSPSGLWLIAFRGLQGVGAALIFGTGTAILTSVFPANERGKALGINVGATYVGLSVGPLIGGLFASTLGWRSIFLLNTLIAMIAIVVVVWKLKGEWADARGEKFDFLGTIIYCFGLLTLMFGFTLLPDLTGVWLILIGVLGIAAFIRLEIKTPFPVLNIGFFKNNRVFAFSNLAALINYSATFAITFLLSLYLQYIKGYAPENAGLILVAQPVVMVICSPLAGRLSDKIEPRIIATTGMALTTVGLTMCAFFGYETNLPYILATQVVMGLGFGLFTSPNTNAALSSVERKSYGVASGILGTMRLLGQTFSQAMALILFALLIGHVQITAPYYPLFLKSMVIVLVISALLSLVGIYASAARGKVPNNAIK
jgi:EmrB/QacA subfamily drug resistance transporter